MCGRVFRVIGCGHDRLPVGIGGRLWVELGFRKLDGARWPPEFKVIFGIETGDRCIGMCNPNRRHQSCVVGEVLLASRELMQISRPITIGWLRVKARHLGLRGAAHRACCRPKRFGLVEVLYVGNAANRRRSARAKLQSMRQGKWLDVDQKF